MKNGSLLAAVVFLAACGSAPKPAPQVATTQTTAAPAAAKEEKSALEMWAEAKVKKEEAAAPKAKAEAQDPLAMSDDGDTALIPKVEKTPAKELRGKGRGDLQAGFGIVRAATTYEEATKKLEKRLGKPTWTENGTKRIWIAREGGKCHRLVLAADGSVEVESAAMNEERQLTATARQNACTGEIKRGVSK
jgi:hypothetical protein